MNRCASCMWNDPIEDPRVPCYFDRPEFSHGGKGCNLYAPESQVENAVSDSKRVFNLIGEAR